MSKPGCTYQNNTDGKPNPKYVDLLEEDKPISGQKFACLSFVSPENILMQTKDQRCQAVACFDLGEFCRFSPNGKTVLERCDVKTKMANLMRDPNVGAEVKKEAITCY